MPVASGPLSSPTLQDMFAESCDSAQRVAVGAEFPRHCRVPQLPIAAGGRTCDSHKNSCPTATSLLFMDASSCPGRCARPAGRRPANGCCTEGPLYASAPCGVGMNILRRWNAVAAMSPISRSSPTTKSSKLRPRRWAELSSRISMSRQSGLDAQAPEPSGSDPT